MINEPPLTPHRQSFSFIPTWMRTVFGLEDKSDLPKGVVIEDARAGYNLDQGGWSNILAARNNRIFIATRAAGIFQYVGFPQPVIFTGTLQQNGGFVENVGQGIQGCPHQLLVVAASFSFTSAVATSTALNVGIIDPQQGTNVSLYNNGAIPVTGGSVGLDWLSLAGGARAWYVPAGMGLVVTLPNVPGASEQATFAATILEFEAGTKAW